MQGEPNIDLTINKRIAYNKTPKSGSRGENKCTKQDTKPCQTHKKSKMFTFIAFITFTTVIGLRMEK